MSTFVGRTEELEALAQVAATSSGPSAAVVTGPPGSGKSRLLSEARSRASGVRSLAVVGFEPERDVPLAAAAGLLRALADVPDHGEILDALVLGSHGRGMHIAAGARTVEPIRIFEAARRAFGTIEPVLLVIDDLHWVDERSLSLCHYLIRAASDSRQRLAVLAATRAGDRGEELVATLPADRVRHLNLGSLSRPEGVALAQALDPQMDPAVAGDLWQRAQGSPFWLEELVRHGQAAQGLRQVLTVRLRGAGPDASALLAVLAVAGRQLSLVAAAELLGRPGDRVEAALHELLQRGLAVASGGEARLAHDLIRAAALAELPDETRLRLHRRMAIRLVHQGGKDLPLLREALEHRRAAGLPVIALASRMARSPQRRLLGQDGLHQLAVLADEADALAPETVALQADVAGPCL
ncbi:MAG: AAA family ATPase [Candidatus Limnocylindria bacterium]